MRQENVSECEKKEVKTLQKTRQSISSELEMSISDSETAWKTDQEKLDKPVFITIEWER